MTDISMSAPHRPRSPYPRQNFTIWDTIGLLSIYWRRRPGQFGIAMLFLSGMVAADLIMPVAAGIMVDQIVTAIDTGGDMSAARWNRPSFS